MDFGLDVLQPYLVFLLDKDHPEQMPSHWNWDELIVESAMEIATAAQGVA
jgi:hypothetical protein